MSNRGTADQFPVFDEPYVIQPLIEERAADRRVTRSSQLGPIPTPPGLPPPVRRRKPSKALGSSIWEPSFSWDHSADLRSVIPSQGTADGELSPTGEGESSAVAVWNPDPPLEHSSSVSRQSSVVTSPGGTVEQLGGVMLTEVEVHAEGEEARAPDGIQLPGGDIPGIVRLTPPVRPPQRPAMVETSAYHDGIGG